MRKSQNLRGIFEHCRKVGAPSHVEQKGLVLCMEWANGDFCFAEFSDPTVLKDFIASRRSWK